MDENEDRPGSGGSEADWRADYLPHEEALQYLSIRYGWSEAVALRKLVEKHEAHLIEGRYSRYTRWAEKKLLRNVLSKDEPLSPLGWHKTSLYRQFPPRTANVPEQPTTSGKERIDQATDEQLCREMHELIERERMSVRSAARRVEGKTRGASPGAREDRLRRCYAKMKKAGLFGPRKIP